MSKVSRESSLRYWDNAHREYKRENIMYDEWLESFDEMIMNCKKPILDLGCGSGNDTKYLIEKGKEVISCDQSQNAINNIKKNFPEVKDAICFNMLDGMPFEDETFEVIIADLCLHYFDEADTKAIVAEIRRILVPGGHLIFRVNSVKDVAHGAGQGPEVEKHVFEMEGKEIKRFFDEDDVRHFFGDFEFEYLNEEIMTRYQKSKPLFKVCAKKI
ncbi:MAG: class I SAM-dependent methyltransferase [Lachnospiraceae bacterium]|nr:class I SAM-dependent methyltransferase [Lachnospiraceae bacterium]